MNQKLISNGNRINRTQSPAKERNDHKFFFYHSGRANPDFFRRIELYQEYAIPFTGNWMDFGPASQFIVITHNDVTIQNADVVYGVSMDKGISNLVAIKMPGG